MTAQEELFGPGGGASDSTLLRVLDEVGDRLGADGLPGRRLARATAAAPGPGRGRPSWPATDSFPRRESPAGT